MFPLLTLHQITALSMAVLLGYRESGPCVSYIDKKPRAKMQSRQDTEAPIIRGGEPKTGYNWTWLSLTWMSEPQRYCWMLYRATGNYPHLYSTSGRSSWYHPRRTRWSPHSQH